MIKWHPQTIEMCLWQSYLKFQPSYSYLTTSIPGARKPSVMSARAFSFTGEETTTKAQEKWPNFRRTTVNDDRDDRGAYDDKPHVLGGHFAVHSNKLQHI